MSARTWISTTVYSKAYLAVAWKSRHLLKDYERRGFAQFIYLTISAHIESVLAELIRRRLYSISRMLHWEKLPPQKFRDGDTEHTCDLKPIYESLLRTIDALKDESHSAPLMKLKEMYDVLFAPKIRDVVGKELHEDMMALSAFRNLFAHGRDLFLEFEDIFSLSSAATLDSNPVQQPAKRLYAAGIIKDLKITGGNYLDFQASLFSDEALLYFHAATEQIETKLFEAIAHLPEQSMPMMMQKLPKLEI